MDLEKPLCDKDFSDYGSTTHYMLWCSEKERNINVYQDRNSSNDIQF